MASKREPNFNERMAAARHAAGLSLQDVAFELRRLLPKAMWASANKLNRLERNTPESKADPVLVCVLAHVYGVDVDDLSPLVAGESDRLALLLVSNGSGPAPPRGRRPKSAWFTAAELRPTLTAAA